MDILASDYWRLQFGKTCSDGEHLNTQNSMRKRHVCMIKKIPSLESEYHLESVLEGREAESKDSRESQMSSRGSGQA